MFRLLSTTRFGGEPVTTPVPPVLTRKRAGYVAQLRGALLSPNCLFRLLSTTRFGGEPVTTPVPPALTNKNAGKVHS